MMMRYGEVKWTKKRTSVYNRIVENVFGHRRLTFLAARIVLCVSTAPLIMAPRTFLLRFTLPESGRARSYMPLNNDTRASVGWSFGIFDALYIRTVPKTTIKKKKKKKKNI
jgi:hypothetical protein